MNCQGQQTRRRRGARTPQLHHARRSEHGERHSERVARAERFANSKWGSAPAAEALPPPPTHWRREGRCRPEPDRAVTLKLLLNVSASA